MNFERSELLGPILDDLAANDQMLFYGLQQRILGDAAKRGMEHSSPTVHLIFQAFRDELSERAKKIFSEMVRVSDGAYIDDFDNFSEELKAEWTRRMTATASIATSEFLNSTQSIRSRLVHPGMPSATSLSEHVENLKLKWFAEIGLFCEKLHDSQAPRLFLKAGEVFAGNRVARAIFAAARQSINIIDTYVGPSVFDMLELTHTTVRIRLMSNKADAATKLAYSLFNKQFNNRAEFRLSDPSTHKQHDRFIVIDGAIALHLGGSIKDLGKSDSLVDSAELEPHKKRFEEVWLRAQPVV